MATTIVEYLNRKRESFADAPLNEVDSLILSTAAYFNLENGALSRTVPTDFLPLPIAICGISHADLYGDIWLEGMGGDAFLEALLASPRFMDLKVGYYAEELSNHFEKQFAAMTFLLPNDAAFVAFRGTDNSLAGWKEDFNLTFMEKTPSQARALTYLEDIANTTLERLYVGGHSKGGNLAEYAALTCCDETFSKVERIFNHDGPGFAFRPSDRIDDQSYRNKLSKTVPESSVFGMLMEDREDYRVVSASGVLFTQHASTHWAVEGDGFVTLDAIRPEASIVSGTLNNWAEMYDPQKREMFIDAVYDLVRTSDAETWSQFAQDRPGNAFAIASAAAKLPADVRATLLRMIGDIAPILNAKASEQFRGVLHPE